MGVPKLKTAKSAKTTPASTDAEVLAQIREAEENGADTWRLIEMAMNHVLQKGASGGFATSMAGNAGKTKLAEILKTLPPRKRAVLRLLYDGLSYKQIAAELGIAHSTVKVTVAGLRKLLGDQAVPKLRNDRTKQD